MFNAARRFQSIILSASKHFQPIVFSAAVLFQSIIIFKAAKRFLIREPARDTPPLRITKILVHPIKSCKGTAVQEARYAPDGIEYDRRLVIVDAKTHVAITARDISKMLLIDPKIHIDESDPYGGKIKISFPADSDCEPFNIPLRPTQDLLESWPMVDNAVVWESTNDGYVVQSLDPDAAYGPDTPSETLSNFLGQNVLLVFKGPRLRWVVPTTNFPQLKANAAFHDGYPILIATDPSLEDIAKRVKVAATAEGDGEDTFKIHGLDKEVWKEKEFAMERFRPNIVIGGEGLLAYDEERWEEIEVGQDHGKMLLVSLCYRCQMPNIDVETGEPDASVPSQ
ncbi:hypothetical protein FRC01_010574, partial [Tulasnella sp. 417]